MSQMNIRLQQIEHFIAVAQQLHFRRASELTSIAQPALSRSIKKLEEQLDVQLLARDNRNVSLTAAGIEFLAGSTVLVDSMKQTVSKAKRARHVESSGITVGYTYIAMCGKLPKLLSNFEAKHNDITLDPVCISSADQLTRLHHNEIDLCFLTGPTNSSDIESVLFQTHPFIAIVKDNERFANRTTISVHELLREKILLRNEKQAATLNNHVLSLFDRTGSTPHIEYLDQDHLSLLGTVALDRGVCIATEGYGSVFENNLKTLKITGTDASVPTVMAWRKDFESDAIRKFRNLALSPMVKPETELRIDSYLHQTPEKPMRLAAN